MKINTFEGTYFKIFLIKENGKTLKVAINNFSIDKHLHCKFDSFNEEVVYYLLNYKKRFDLMLESKNGKCLHLKNVTFDLNSFRQFSLVNYCKISFDSYKISMKTPKSEECKTNNHNSNNHNSKIRKVKVLKCL